MWHYEGSNFTLKSLILKNAGIDSAKMVQMQNLAHISKLMAQIPH